MFSAREANRIAKEVNENEGATLEEEEFSSDPAVIEARIDVKLKEAAERGETGCYIEPEELGDDPDSIAEKYKGNGWEVYFNDKANAWHFVAQDKDEEINPW